MHPLLRLLLGLALVAATAHGHAAPVRVLFVGNSYTYTHNLPEVFRRVAASRGRAVTVSAVTAPGVAIEDHFQVGNLPRALQGDWDWVVVQQGPSSLPENRLHLAYWTAQLARHLDPARTRLVLYSVWPAQEHGYTWLNAELSYARAAQKSGGCLFPAAAAWRQAMADDATLPLYGPDGLHPSREGVLLSALTLAHALWPRLDKAGSPIDLRPQFSESAWQAALTRVPRLDASAAQAAREARPACAD